MESAKSPRVRTSSDDEEEEDEDDKTWRREAADRLTVSAISALSGDDHLYCRI